MIYTDQLFRDVEIPEYPSSIISIVPSITELLADLSLDMQISGITKFCIHPESIFRSKPRIGGTKTLDHKIIDQLQPDLIIANKEENLESDINILESKYPVWVSDISTLEDALKMIVSIGQITGKQEKAVQLHEYISNQFRQIIPLKGIRTMYLIWKNPYMSVGSDTFINEMMNYCGMKNILSDRTRYPEITKDEIVNYNPDLVLLSSEPFPFREKHIAELEALLPKSVILLADGEFFSWYGSRLAGAPEYFNKLNNRVKERLAEIH